MQLTATDLIAELLHLHRSGTLGYSTTARRHRDIILGHLDGLPRWDGHDQRTFQVPAEIGLVLVLCRTEKGLIYKFHALESPLTLIFSVADWHMHSEDCETCGGAMTVQDVVCFNCSPQEVS